MISRKVLVCPLDWGIGHASRCVPVIRKFLAAGMRVVIAADGRPLEFLKSEFPQCRYVRFPGIRIRYPEKGSMIRKILLQSPKMLLGICREHRVLKRIVRLEKPDIIFSDNRYGLWSRETTCIFMTHQLEVQMPARLKIFQSLVRRFIYRFIKKYDACWIPDFELNQGLAGKLSHPTVVPPHAVYIGTLSRFLENKSRYGPEPEIAYDFMAILSGPEPQRTLFEGILLRELERSGKSAVVVLGRTEEQQDIMLNGRIRVISHAETDRMRELILQSGMIICRAGYSSIMDLVSLGKRAILVPTPGQTEQEYLARLLLDKKIFFSLPQKSFDLTYAMEMSVNYPGMVLQNDYAVLEEKISALSR
ncbi:MAG TPA: glycosyltransferase [Bacteroidales bacterium]|nr:glycosyltransferase [Bacteroidales bacterium]